MPKRLVVCCDGTWNIADQSVEGYTCPTNVTKVALAVAPRGDDGRQQDVAYLRGVGTNRGQRLRGGAFGLGLSAQVKDAYRAIAEKFEPGDEIFLFGFSRGAYTARSCAGFIRNSGVLRREHLGRLDEAYRLYRDRTVHPRGIEAQLFRRSYSHETRIHFIGVWDTVGALGIPVCHLSWMSRRWAFHDTQLSSTVDNAFQALAIDEDRRPFRATLWTRPDAAPHPDQRIEQVWFAGVHCSIGGGYRDTSLSDIALIWMVQRAQECGLGFSEDVLRRLPRAGTVPEDNRVYLAADAVGPLQRSRKRLYRLSAPCPRPIGEAYPETERVSSTAQVRYADGRSRYRPPELAAYLTVGGPVQPVRLDWRAGAGEAAAIPPSRSAAEDVSVPRAPLR